MQATKCPRAQDNEKSVHNELSVLYVNNEYKFTIIVDPKNDIEKKQKKKKSENYILRLVGTAHFDSYTIFK